MSTKQLMLLGAIGGAAAYGVNLFTDPDRAYTKREAYAIAAALPIGAFLVVKSLKIA